MGYGPGGVSCGPDGVPCGPGTPTAPKRGSGGPGGAARATVASGHGSSALPSGPSGVPGRATGDGRGGWREAARLVADRALELLSPTRCVVCERPGALICDGCRASIEHIDPRESCVECGAPFGRITCTECDMGKGALDRCLAAAVFEGAPASIVRAYKDGGERRLAHEIASIVAEAAREAERIAPDRYGGILSSADAVTFVPATASAYRRRGFDHMEAVAREVALETGAPVLDALVKFGHADQRAFGRKERLAAGAGAYGVVEPVEGLRLLVLDDVITTGSTLRAVAATLKNAGAAHVDALALARVWG